MADPISPKEKKLQDLMDSEMSDEGIGGGEASHVSGINKLPEKPNPFGERAVDLSQSHYKTPISLI